uniref:Ribosomal protein L11 C-terminal domain-containing protein n=1 Tax=Solanum lycopersicum TaxID=4081 RepID=A0A3Q7GW07_SOLLC
MSSIKPKPTSWGHHPEPTLASLTVISSVYAFLSKVSVVPSTAALVIKALKEQNPRSMAKDLSETVKEILGICVSVGCSVDVKDPKDLQQEIIDGDEEIPQDWLLIDGIRVNYELIIPLMEVSSV